MKRIIALCLSVLTSTTMLTGCYSGILNRFLNSEEPYDEDITELGTFSSEDIEEPTFATLAPLTEPPTAAQITVRPAKWAAIQWEPYANQYITLQIPSGWQVECQGDANRLYWRVTSPDGTVGLSNLDHNYAAKDASMKDTLGMAYSLSDGTVQEFFETVYADSTDYFTVQNSCVPDNKEQLQSIRPSTPIRDYQSLYATFKDSNVEGEGIYTAVIMDSPDVVVRGSNYGVWEINCIFTEWAPQGTLVNWSPVLAVIAKSFGYTDYYLQQWRQIANDATSSPSSSVNDPDPVMEAFEERSKSDTIIQEKRSDMLQEYERVYDNSTGEIYRAYNGFLDDMGDQNRYVPITDNQYTEGYKGWIDKY